MKEKVIYINRKGNGYLETVDEFPYNNRKERKYAQEMCGEYNYGDPQGYYYLSQRCCKDWRDKP